MTYTHDARLTTYISAFAPIMLQLLGASAQLNEASADTKADFCFQIKDLAVF